MKPGAPAPFGTRLKALREKAGFTQEELATIAGLSVHAVSALERGERRRPHVETVRALSAALDLNSAARDGLLASARPVHDSAVDALNQVSLPFALTALVGRDGDVRTLHQWAADPTARLITLVGPGGVGKTRLALELSREIAQQGSTRVVFVPLAAIREPVFVASAIAEALGLADVAARDLPNRARLASDHRPTLLVLDNFEQVLEAAPLIAELLTSVASLRLVATSRAPLRVRGEREYAVGPLVLESGSEEMAPADLARTPAVRLFVERVRDVQPDFRLTGANARTVAAICRRLDALPLALELAAPWIKVLTAEGLLRRLEHHVLLSAISPRDLPHRQQTMNATVAWSYQLLDADEQRAFRRFGALPGLFPIDAAATVLIGREAGAGGTEAALRAAASLMDKSLLWRADTSAVPTCPLYYMLETVRAYAVLELTAAGERDDAMEGLARYCIGEASLASAGLVGPAQVEWLDRVREDLESYRAALTWLIDRDRSADAAAVAWNLMFFWLIRGHAGEGLRWYEQIQAMRAVAPAGECRVLVGAAAMRYALGELPRARSALTRALRLASDSVDREMVAHCQIVLGHVAHAGGDMDTAREQFTLSIEGFRALGVPWGIANALSAMAGVALAGGDVTEAERLLNEATFVPPDVGPWFASLTLYVRAILAVRCGAPEDAFACVRESLTRVRDLRDKFAFVAALVPLASAALLTGNHTWVARILGARDAVIERTGITVVDTPVRDLLEQAEREARARLGPSRWAHAYAAGRLASIDSLIADIDLIVNRFQSS